MAQEQKSLLPGLILIAVGGYLLLRKLGIVHLRWTEVYPLLLLAGGLFFLIPVVKQRDAGAAFPATILLLLGLFFFMRNYDLLGFDYYFYGAGDFWPIFLIAFGAAFVVQYFFKSEDWGTLVVGGVMLFLGVVFLLRNLHLFYWFDFSTFWPLILILIGLSLVVNGIRKRHH